MVIRYGRRAPELRDRVLCIPGGKSQLTEATVLSRLTEATVLSRLTEAAVLSRLTEATVRAVHTWR